MRIIRSKLATPATAITVKRIVFHAHTHTHTETETETKLKLNVTLFSLSLCLRFWPFSVIVMTGALF